MHEKSSPQNTDQTAASASPVANAPQSPEPYIALWFRRHSLLIFSLLVILGSLRIAATYNVFSHTYDEPAHIGCGMEWLTLGSYRFEPQHPPLARVAAAVGPYLANGRLQKVPTMAEEGLSAIDVKRMWDAGLAILHREGHYDRNLALARLGILPFFWVASLVVYLWTKRYLGEPAAAFSVFFFTFLPPILAHAGFATTDMALTAFVGASFLTALFWLETPDLIRSVLFGAATALAVLSKFSALPFVPMSMMAALIWYFLADRKSFLESIRNANKYVEPIGQVALVAFVLIWAAYRFSIGRVTFIPFSVPFPELFAGIAQVIVHNHRGDLTYLLGEHSTSGHWYFYFIVLAVKTPLPFLALLFYGAIVVVRRKFTPGVQVALAFSLGILGFSLFSNINLGVRHILPVYIGFSILAAAGAQHLFHRASSNKWAAWTLGGVLIWMAVTSMAIHPDYLSYFNILAGNEPEKILVDSDLDWGQDLKRLATRLREVGAKEVAFDPFQPADLAALGFPPVRPTDPLNPLPGWNAVSLTRLESHRMGLYSTRPTLALWPNLNPPTERIGKGVWLWNFPPAPTPSPITHP